MNSKNKYASTPDATPSPDPTAGWAAPTKFSHTSSLDVSSSDLDQKFPDLTTPPGIPYDLYRNTPTPVASNTSLDPTLAFIDDLEDFDATLL